MLYSVVLVSATHEHESAAGHTWVPSRLEAGTQRRLELPASSSRFPPAVRSSFSPRGRQGLLLRPFQVSGPDSRCSLNTCLLNVTNPPGEVSPERAPEGFPPIKAVGCSVLPWAAAVGGPRSQGKSILTRIRSVRLSNKPAASSA